MKPNKEDTNWVIIVFFLLLLLVIYVASLGKVDVGTSFSFDEFKDNKEQAKRRHDKLKVLLEKKEALKTKLTKRFNRIYFAVRFSFVVLWGVYLFVLYKVGLVQNLEDGINYSEAAILGWLALNFLTFGNVSNLKNFLGLIKMKLQNWIWGKHINIEGSIVECKVKIEACQVEIRKCE
ncbi:hypothetical protein [uncultured Draconibacterium sp.]|uniref:hypothetical protein n=1 Tax=uncultured Draconibacterium sp. TaxID=1573823 RepID=UPI002AA8D936|nr:hypothetical protein [uncultured Draconibacterium sp.]